MKQIFYSQSVFSRSKENENKKWLRKQEATLQCLSITRGISTACSQALESLRRLILHSIKRIRCSLALFWHVSVLDLCDGEEVSQALVSVIQRETQKVPQERRKAHGFAMKTLNPWAGCFLWVWTRCVGKEFTPR